MAARTTFGENGAASQRRLIGAIDRLRHGNLRHRENQDQHGYRSESGEHRFLPLMEASQLIGFPDAAPLHPRGAPPMRAWPSPALLWPGAFDQQRLGNPVHPDELEDGGQRSLGPNPFILGVEPLVRRMESTGQATVAHYDGGNPE